MDDPKRSMVAHTHATAVRSCSANPFYNDLSGQGEEGLIYRAQGVICLGSAGGSALGIYQGGRSEGRPGATQIGERGPSRISVGMGAQGSISTGSWCQGPAQRCPEMF